MMKFSSSIKKIISSAKHKVSPTSTSGAGLQGKVLIKKRKQELLAVQWLRLHAPMQGDRFYCWLGKQLSFAQVADQQTVSSISSGAAAGERVTWAEPHPSGLPTASVTFGLLK